MNEIIIDGNIERKKDEQYKSIAVNALKFMSETLVEMEASGMKSDEMMKFCVWPILEECKERFEKVNKGDDIKVDGFERLFDKPR